jgi:hypothetical protein
LLDGLGDELGAIGTLTLPGDEEVTRFYFSRIVVQAGDPGIFFSMKGTSKSLGDLGKKGTVGAKG